MTHAVSNGHMPSSDEPGGQAAFRSLPYSHGYSSGLLSAPTAAAQPSAAHSVTTASCWMCGIYLPVGQLVSDGASACEDIRWYCRDTVACTERWTSAKGNHSTSP